MLNYGDGYSYVAHNKNWWIILKSSKNYKDKASKKLAITRQPYIPTYIAICKHDGNLPLVLLYNFCRITMITCMITVYSVKLNVA